MTKLAEPRCAVLVGPYLSGKTTLLESLLSITGTVNRKGTVKEGNTVGDSSLEARGRQMSTELTVAPATYLDDQWTFIDCPGSVEFFQDSQDALSIADIAVVVVEPETDRAIMLSPLLRFLDSRNIPHMIFINKVDTADASPSDVLAAYQAVSERPLVMRQVPIQDEDTIRGYVDLISDRAYNYKSGSASDLVEIPVELQEIEQSARTEMLETLADFDDDLLTQLIEDVVPPKEEIYQFLKKDIADDKVVPVLFGSAENDQGVRRLLKALRHDVPDPVATADRLGIEAKGEPLAWIFKTIHAPHLGKLSLARILRGAIKDNTALGSAHPSGMFRLTGEKHEKLGEAKLGEIAAMGRLEAAKTGDILTSSGKVPDGLESFPKPLSPMYSAAISTEKSSDEVKLTEALAKIREEDPSLSYEQNLDTHELVLWGQGEMHLQIASDRFKNKFNLSSVTMKKPQVPYSETISKPVSQHARFKRQTGGHGQFGDVHVDIKPLPRGSGFKFDNTVVGGHVPRQFIPAVENGVKEYLKSGPLGFPVVDLSVTLTDGQHHAVDSSEQAFKQAGRLAMSEGLPQCKPVLLEPICKVTISLPTEFTSKAQRVISGRRGQILGFDAKSGWKSWDEVSSLMPQAEMYDLIIELRSLSSGAGSYTFEFDHKQELTGRDADQVISARAETKKAS
ncbi:MAG: elongation factor G [Alphaproteobacteria bacterium]|nr:elongation factor G [Alphaproteobacteria bacterium]